MNKIFALIWMIVGAAIMWLVLAAYPRFHPDNVVETATALAEQPESPPKSSQSTQQPSIPPIAPPSWQRFKEVAALPFPESGSTISYTDTPTTAAPLTVIASTGGAENCLVKLEEWATNQPILELFVKAHETAETKAVPLGEYRLKIACGETWHGRENLFGRSTRITVGAAPLKFRKEGNTTIGHTINLTDRLEGNMHMQEAITGNL